MNQIFTKWYLVFLLISVTGCNLLAGESEDLFLIPSDGKLQSIRFNDNEFLQDWAADGQVVWSLDASQQFSGNFYIHYSCEEGHGGEAELLIDGKKVLDITVPATKGWWQKKVINAGQVTIAPGKHTVELKTTGVNNKWLMQYYAGLFSARKIVKPGKQFPQFPPAAITYVNKGTFSASVTRLLDIGFGESFRIRQANLKGLWDDYPIHMSWLTQDAVDKEAARLDATYNVTKDVIQLFNADRHTALEQKIILSAIEELGPKAIIFKTELAELVKMNTSIKDVRWLDLYERICRVRRKMRLEPLLARTNQVVFAKHQVFGSKSGILYINETEGTEQKSELCTIDLTPEKSGNFARVSTMVDSQGGMMRDPNVSFDGKRMLFAWRKTTKDIGSWVGAPAVGNYQIYEMELATGSIRQLTTDETYGANFEGIYLPNGDIMFSSARIVQHITCGWGDCSNLFLMDQDGNYQRRVGFDQTNTMSPAVTNDGRVLYLRRDYNDRGQSSAHALFQMMPDGTNQTEYYGNQTGTPNSFQHPFAIPGSNKIAIVLGGYHTRQGGQLAIMDVRNGRQNDEGLVRIPQGDKPPTQAGYDDSYAKQGIQYANPYALSETEFIVSRSETWGPGTNEQYRVFFMTADGRRELLASDRDTSCLQPVAVMPRQQPSVRSSLVDYSKKTGTFYLQNAYFGDAVQGVKPGTLKKIRVVELLYKPTTIGAGMGLGPGGMWHTVTPTGHPLASFDSKRILGEATVHADGSAMFEVPARKPVYLQLLDGQNRVVQTMRSWATLMPGETFSCVGCHENKDDVPVMSGKVTMAMKQGVEKLKPFYGEPRAFSYLKEVQPVFDKHCTECHSVGGEAEELVLTAKPFVKESAASSTYTGRSFAQSYVNLAAARPAQDDITPDQYKVKSSIDKWHRMGKQLPDEPNRYISYWTRFETMGARKPYRSGSIKSGLVKKLESGHVKGLPQEALDKIKAWIDLNMVYAGEYDESNNWSPDQIAKYNERMAERKRNEEIEVKAISELIEAGQ